jgi:hypothetical protein
MESDSDQRAQSLKPAASDSPAATRAKKKLSVEETSKVSAPRKKKTGRP